MVAELARLSRSERFDPISPGDLDFAMSGPHHSLTLAAARLRDERPSVMTPRPQRDTPPQTKGPLAQRGLNWGSRVGPPKGILVEIVEYGSK